MSVYVVDDLEFFKECAEASDIKVFRIWPTKNGFLVKMRANGVGFRKEYSKKDSELGKIKELVEREGFVRVVSIEGDNEFFDS